MLQFFNSLSGQKKSMLGSYTFQTALPDFDEKLWASDIYYQNGIYNCIARGWDSPSKEAFVTDYYTATELDSGRFTAYPSNPVFDITSPPTIIRSYIRTFFVDDDGTIYGFYAYPEGNGYTDLCLATSTDWINWTDKGIIIEATVDEPSSIFAGATIKENGRLYVFCTNAESLPQSTTLNYIKCYSSATPSDVNSYVDEGIILNYSPGGRGAKLGDISIGGLNKRGNVYEMAVIDLYNRNKIWGFTSTSLLSGYTEQGLIYQDFLVDEPSYTSTEIIPKTAFYYDRFTNNWYLYYNIRDENLPLEQARMAKS
jgi:hypothetical protein